MLSSHGVEFLRVTEDQPVRQYQLKYVKPHETNKLRLLYAALAFEDCIESIPFCLTTNVMTVKVR